MRIAFALFVLFFACNTHAAGFDCEKAATAVEELVCKSAELSDFDSELNRVYRMRTMYASKQVSSAAQAEQKNWLTSVRDKCKDEACLSMAYLSRLDKLASVRTTMSEGRYVTGRAEFSKQEADFRKSLSRQGNSAGLSGCPVMIRLIDNTGGRDSSYGAFCLLKGDRLIMICDDTMIGKLTIKYSGFAVSSDELVDFTRANCPRGG